MKAKVFLKKVITICRGNVFSVALFVFIIVILLSGFRQASVSQADEALRIAEESIYRAVVSCYAIEGSYPQDFKYIKDNYNVSIDERKYFVHYSVFASNVMPDISVIKK